MIGLLKDWCVIRGNKICALRGHDVEAVLTQSRHCQLMMAHFELETKGRKALQCRLTICSVWFRGCLAAVNDCCVGRFVERFERKLVRSGGICLQIEKSVCQRL